MPTITASPGLVSFATERVTTLTPINYVSVPSDTANLDFSIFSAIIDNASGGSGAGTNSPAFMYFKNSLGNTLTSTSMSQFTRTMATNGYVVFSNLPPLTVNVSGTIAYIEINNVNITHWVGFNSGLVSSPYTITLTVGAIGSGADVEIDNRDVTTTQQWRLDGSIRFRVPNTFTYSL
jgi:hypothetical protein